MKRNVILIISTGIFALLFWSCNDDENVLEAKTDAYILKRGDDSQNKYAMGFLVSANKEISSAAVNTPINENVNLIQNPNNSYVFLQEPLLNDFTNEMPALGDYLFEVHSSDGEIFQSTDQVAYDNLPIPVINFIEYKTDSKVLEVEWDPVANADGFAVKVTETNGEIAYVGFTLDWDATSYVITSEQGNWITAPAIGHNYILEVHAFTHEDGVDTAEEVYNLKEISIATEAIVWGQ